MRPFRVHKGKVAPLERANVDTDQIIPKQFLKRIERTGFGQFLFYDWRYNADGSPDPSFVLNEPRYRSASILVAGRNFGCGSSREHAPWALLDYGFRAVVAPSFADIFRGNALKNGLLPIAVSETDHRELVAGLQRDPRLSLTVDLATQTLEHSSGSRCAFPIDPFAKRCLLDGVDQLGFLLAARDEIASYERGHAATVQTTA